MDWIIAVWNKINKPQHFLAVGIVVIIIAPEQINWSGWIFIAIGTVGILDWLFGKLNGFWLLHKQKQKIKKSLPTLNGHEKVLLQTQFTKGEKTFYFDPFSTQSLPEHTQKAGVLAGLVSKGFLKAWHATADGKSTTFHITDQAWDLLQKPENRKMLDK